MWQPIDKQSVNYSCIRLRFSSFIRWKKGGIYLFVRFIFRDRCAANLLDFARKKGVDRQVLALGIH